MKREDFKKITEKHIETAKELISLFGKCAEIKCDDCPFCSYNSTISIKSCTDLYSEENRDGDEGDEKLLKSAKEFLEMCEKTGAIIGEGTIDKSVPSEIQEDKIKSPSHYRLEGLNCETIDVVKARLGKEGFKAFCVGNVLKYVLRAEKKNGLEDYKKSKQYLEWIIEGGEND